ncbi:MAG TPA: hypothetical protein ENJ57_04965 [Rhizobiales bacterium]|nr:hypothetical protein [Hyphomicrobiales bacterium]
MADKPRSIKAHDDEARRKALAELENLEHQVEGLPGTGMGRALKGAEARMKASGLVDEDDEANDPVVIWGKKTGRWFGFALLAYILYHLVTTYISK